MCIVRSKIQYMASKGEGDLLPTVSGLFMLIGIDMRY